MNILIQNILVFLIFVMAIGFLARKFFWKPKLATKEKSSSPCGVSKCGCH